MTQRIASIRAHLTGLAAQDWRRPDIMLYAMAASAAIAFAVWRVLLNNFAIERVAFDGAEMGILQSLREVPGFLAFGVVFLLFVIREQTLALVALAFLGLGTALTGFFPSIIGLYCTTVLMSLGFHYYETINQSLALQWLSHDEAPEALGRMIAVNGFGSIVAFGVVLGTWRILGLDYVWVYAIGGVLAMAIVVYLWARFPRFPQDTEQRRHLVFRSRYWLYYALNFMSGARRQIFVVFAAFMMVEKFGYSVEAVTILFLINCVFNIFLAPWVGRLIRTWGERRALTFEYAGLVIVFTMYAFVDNAWVAAGLYLIDHAFFALAIAMRTYFQKIADPGDLASTAGVSFSIDHTASVIIPAWFGFIWLVSPPAVFLCGAVLAFISLVLSRLVPRDPRPGAEIVWKEPKTVPVPAE